MNTHASVLGCHCPGASWWPDGVFPPPLLPSPPASHSVVHSLPGAVSLPCPTAHWFGRRIPRVSLGKSRGRHHTPLRARKGTLCPLGVTPGLPCSPAPGGHQLLGVSTDRPVPTLHGKGPRDPSCLAPLGSSGCSSPYPGLSVLPCSVSALSCGQPWVSFHLLLQGWREEQGCGPPRTRPGSSPCPHAGSAHSVSAALCSPSVDS